MANSAGKKTDEHVVHAYNRFPVTLERGEGVYVYDTNGKKYLDFAAGVAVSSLGYGNQELNDVLKMQIDKMCHTSNYYYNEACGKAAADLSAVSGMDKVFFCNSGTEAIEGSLKAARKYAYAKQSGRTQFIAMQDSFHGRSMGALSVTGQEQYRTPFEPLIPGVQFAVFNDLESVKELVNEKTCAIILEPLQGEGGIQLAEREFLQGIRALCDEQDILLIFDEIQCGMGRTGSMFLWQQFDVKPDIMAMAKAIGSGLPVGAFGLTEKVASQSLVPGDHGSTYGGNPLVCAAVSKTIEIFERDGIADHVREVGDYLSGQLDQIKADFDSVIKRKGTGLIQGLEMNKPTGELIEQAITEGLLIISAGKNVLRLVPPLVITKEHVDEMIGKLKRVLTYC